MNPNEVSPISDVTDVESIRVVLYYNGRLVHVPLRAVLKEIQAAIDDLDSRVETLETP